MKRRDAVMACAAAVLIAWGTPAAAQTTATIHVATTPIDLGAEALYANDMGFFKDAGLDVDVSILGSGSAIAAAVSGGSIDIGQSNVVALATARQNGFPFVIVAPAGYYTSSGPTTALIVASTSTAKAARDLDDKTIAVTALRDLNWVGIQSWLTAGGATVDSVKFVEVPQAAVCAALTAGRAAAGIVSEPYLTTALGSGCRVLAPTHDAIAKEFLVGAWFSTSAWASTHPDILRRFRAVIVRTARWANTHRDASAAILEKYTKLATPPGMKRVPFAESVNLGQVQTVIDAAAKYGALKGTFPASDLVLP